MPTVQKLSDITRTIPVRWDEEVIHVTYRLAAINTQLQDWLDEKGDDRGSLFTWIEKVVTDWDMTDDGQPVAPTRENLEKYGFASAMLRLIQQAIYEDSSWGNLKKSFASRSLELETLTPRGSSSSSTPSD